MLWLLTLAVNILDATPDLFIIECGNEAKRSASGASFLGGWVLRVHKRPPRLHETKRGARLLGPAPAKPLESRAVRQRIDAANLFVFKAAVVVALRL
jgi:hypothetical protein